MKLKKISLIWYDSNMSPQGWEWEEDIEDKDLLVVQTTGLLLKETDKSVTVIHSRTSAGQLFGRMLIPKCSIISGYGARKEGK